MSILSEERARFHLGLREAGLLRVSDAGIPSMSDSRNRTSVAAGRGMLEALGPIEIGARLGGQLAGNRLEGEVLRFLGNVFPQLSVLRSGTFRVERGSPIYRYDQYKHLRRLDALARTHTPEARELRLALGSDYLVKPDVVIVREPVTEETLICEGRPIADDAVGRRSSVRRLTVSVESLHASISCKWTMRSDRAQNARSEALNLIRNRKGRLPHIVVVTGEADPRIIASLAQGTADLDCVYHVALDELIGAVNSPALEKAKRTLHDMVDGQRIRDIADLPLDLTI